MALIFILIQIMLNFHISLCFRFIIKYLRLILNNYYFYIFIRLFSVFFPRNNSFYCVTIFLVSESFVTDLTIDLLKL